MTLESNRGIGEETFESVCAMPVSSLGQRKSRKNPNNVCSGWISGQAGWCSNEAATRNVCFHKLFCIILQMPEDFCGAHVQLKFQISSICMLAGCSNLFCFLFYDHLSRSLSRPGKVIKCCDADRALLFCRNNTSNISDERISFPKLVLLKENSCT